MKKAVRLTLPLLLLILIVVIVSVSQAHLTPGWQTELDQYIAFKNEHAYSVTLVQAVVQAKRPWNFKPAETLNLIQNDIFDKRRLPQPPVEVWCVLLKEQDNLAGQVHYAVAQRIIFIGLHADLYFDDWIIYAAEDSAITPQMTDIMTNIGCDFTPALLHDASR